MKIMIDGPQGTGKTTLVHELLNLNPHLTHQRWDATRFMTHEALLESNTLHERGWTAEHVYNLLWNVTDRPVMNRNMFEYEMAQLDKVLIYYADDVQVLIDRIKNRADETGREISELEWNVLAYSNELYKGLGAMLSLIAPSKVTMIEASSYSDPALFARQLIEEWAGESMT